MRLPAFVRRHRCLARLRAALRTRPYTILMFHSVGRPAAAGFLPSALDCSPTLFEKVLRLLRAEAKVLPLQELADRLRTKERAGGAVALTFDDGFRDNFAVALPLLRRHGLPATIFVASDAVDSEKLLPIHRYYYARQLGGAFAETVDSPARRAQVETFLNERGVVIPPLGRELYLRWDELRALADAGIEIGAHTCSHPWLAALTADEQRAEIVRSKEALEQAVGGPVTSFAYPFGYQGSFNQTSAAIVAEQFRVACLSGETAIGNNPLALPRVNIANFGA